MMLLRQSTAEVLSKYGSN